MKFLFTPFCEKNFHFVFQCNRVFATFLVVYEVVKVDEIGFVRSEEMLAREASLNLLQDFCK